MSNMPPWANRIIQPAVRVVEPMNSGNTVSTTKADFQRLVLRASRQAIGRPSSMQIAVTMTETRMVVSSTFQ